MEYLKDTRRFADLINGTIFQGRQVVMPEYLREVQRKKRILLKTIPKKGGENGRHLQKKKTDYVPKKKQKAALEYMERERDVMMVYEKPGERCLFDCEGQSEADYTMPVRNLTYDGIEYSEQVKSQEYKTKEKDGTVHPLIPVFNQVLYLGENRWNSKHTLQEMMKIPETMGEFISVLPDYRVRVADIHDQDPERFHTEWKDIFRLMNHSQKKEELKTYIENHKSEIQKLSLETKCFLAVLLDQYEILEDNEVEVKDVCKAWDGAMLMYMDEGMQKGLKKGIKKGTRRGIKRGRKQGMEAARRNTILRMLSKKKFTYEEIAEYNGVSVETVKRIGMSDTKVNIC